MLQVNLSILVVDDDEDDRVFLAEAILKLDPNAHLHAFENGSEAINYLLNLAPSHYPDLIILDYNMPLLNGLETLEKIVSKKSFDCIPIVVISTSSSPIDRSQCLKSGAKKFFVKPADTVHWDQIAEELYQIV